MRLDQPKLLVDAARDFGKQISSVHIAESGCLIDGLSYGLTERRERAGNSEHMLSFVGDIESIGEEEGVFRRDLHSAMRGATKPPARSAIRSE